jgi:renal tumor antigen
MNIYELIRGRRNYVAEDRIKSYMYQLMKGLPLTQHCSHSHIELLILVFNTQVRADVVDLSILMIPFLITFGAAMDHMHRNGIFHRDIKPENILIMEDQLKVKQLLSG